MAERMLKNKTFPSTSYHESDVDVDTIIQDNISYSIYPDDDHSKLPSTSRCFFKCNHGEGGYITQTSCFENGSFWYRNRMGNDWSPWVRLDNFGYNSITDLKNGIIPQYQSFLFLGDNNWKEMPLRVSVSTWGTQFGLLFFASTQESDSFCNNVEFGVLRFAYSYTDVQKHTIFKINGRSDKWCEFKTEDGKLWVRCDLYNCPCCLSVLS